ncbi:MAG: hypothetical protein ABR562_00575 [Thermoplasmatota archaeon]|nr:hypothetical protein [Halobacteriales archaeon]
MSLALRYGACGSFFLAAILMGAAFFLPVEHIDFSTPDRAGRIHAGTWAVDGGLPEPGGNTTKAGSWYDGAFSDAKGTTRLRIAGPLLLVGFLVLLACGFMVLSGQGVRTGWVGTAGLLVAGLGSLFLLLGITAFAKSITTTNAVLDTGIRPEIGFWCMFLGLVVGCGAALASFSVKPEAKGRVGPDGEPLPPLPILSVENPSAFNPMANRDPRPFKQEEQQYKSFEVTGGPKTFKTGKEGEPKEDTWEEMEAAPPAKPTPPKPEAAAKPGTKPGGAPEGKAAANPAPPAAKSEASAKPPTKPAEKPKA